MRASEIEAALRARFSAPEWALFFQVGDATGASQRRWADAIAMNLYPSRGLRIHGFEIKVSRSDWIRELKNPGKAEAIQRYCDHWWIVAPKDVVRREELPPTWGLYEVAQNQKVKRIIDAEKLETAPLDRSFVAALLRRSAAGADALINAIVEQRTTDVREQERAIAKRTVDTGLSELRELQAQLAQIEQISGLKITQLRFDAARAGQAIKAVLAFEDAMRELGARYGGLQRIHALTTKLTDQCTHAMAVIQATQAELGVHDHAPPAVSPEAPLS